MLHVVAQIVEAELVIGAVSDVAGIGLATCLLGEVGDDDADRQAEEAVNASHPLRVARSEVIVHRDDVDTLALDRVQIGGERCDKRLALTSAHLGDLATMQHDAANELNVEMPHFEHPDGRLAHGSERFGKDGVERPALVEHGAEPPGLRGQLLVRHRLHPLFERVDLGSELGDRLHITVVRRSEDRLGYSLKHGWVFLIRTKIAAPMKSGSARLGAGTPLLERVIRLDPPGDKRWPGFADEARQRRCVGMRGELRGRTAFLPGRRFRQFQPRFGRGHQIARRGCGFRGGSAGRESLRQEGKAG